MYCKSFMRIYFILIFNYYQPYNYISIDLNYILNTNLINGLFIIHPILVYVYYSFCCFIILITLIFYFNLNAKFNNVNICKLLLKKIHFILKIKLYLIFLAIALGSLWAYQELTWGTWWNWDLIEVVNLIYFLFVLNLNHENKLFLLKNNLFLFLKNLMVFFILYLSVRYSLIQSIHNFLNIQIQNQFNIYIYIYLTLILFIIKSIKLIKPTYIFKLQNNTYIYILITFALVINILNNLFNINISFLIIYSQKLTIAIILSLFTFFIMKKLNKIYTTFTFMQINTYLLPILYLYNFIKNIRGYKILHLHIILITVLTVTFFYNIKNYNIYANLNYQLINIINDTNYMLMSTKINSLINSNFIQTTFFLNINLKQNFIEYLSYNTQHSNIKYLLPNWNEFNNYTYNRYLFVYLSIYLYLLLNLIYTIIFTSIYFIRKIYY